MDLNYIILLPIGDSPADLPSFVFRETLRDVEDYIAGLPPYQQVRVRAFVLTELDKDVLMS